MHNSILARIEHELTERAHKHLLRTLAHPTDGIRIDCATNSYLDLQSEPVVLLEAGRLSRNMPSGNLASRLISERTPLFMELEAEIADWKNTEEALVFTSGYAANIGIISAIANRHTEIFSDRLNHASIIDGIMLSRAKLTRYAHNDMSDLQNKILASTAQEKLIITDSLFSMDGDRAPLADICTIAQKYSCMVMVDEAHATGIFGKRASGLCELCGVEDAVDIRMGTLSKALGGQGGFFAGSTLLRDYLVNNARSFVFSTGLAPVNVAYAIAAIRWIREHPEKGQTLLSKAEKFRNLLAQAGFNTLNSTSQIVPVVIESDEKAVALSQALLKKGIRVPAIRPPTVPAGTARLRFSIHAGLTEDKLRCVVKELQTEY